jgi:hypothetical protein
MELGIAEERLGLAGDAVQHLESACRMMPGSAQCQRELQTAKEKRK